MLCFLPILLIRSHFPLGDGENSSFLEPLSLLILLTFPGQFHLNCWFLWSSQVSIQLPSRTSIQRSHWHSKLDYTNRSSMSPETTSSLYFIIYSTTIIQARISLISLLRHHIIEVMINPTDSSAGHILLCRHCLKAGLNYLWFGFLYRFQLPSKPLSKLPTEWLCKMKIWSKTFIWSLWLTREKHKSSMACEASCSGCCASAHTHAHTDVHTHHTHSDVNSSGFLPTPYTSHT